MKSKLKEIFKPDIIEFLSNNKNEITSDLLIEMRKFGNEGKHLALQILDFPKDSEQYYLDAFGNRMSVNGNRRLKKPFSKLDLHPIHIEELQKCKNDIHYFKDNYVKIRTKSGVDFPEVREYQNDFISLLDSDEEGVIGLMGRQSSKSISTSIYLSHLTIFNSEKNIGIVANKGSLAREFLSNVKNIILELPVWMQVGVKAWNKSFVEFENDMRILTDVPSQDSFRGFSIHVAVIDETAFIRPNIWEEFIDAFLPSQASLSWKKNIILSTPKGMNHFYTLVKGASPHFDTDGSGVKPKGAINNSYSLFKVDWKDVPRYNHLGERIPPEDFMNNIIKKHGVLYWKQNFECISGDSVVTIFDKNTNLIQNIEIANLDKIVAKDKINERYLIKTKNGFESFKNVINKNFLQSLYIKTNNTEIKCSLKHKFVVKDEVKTAEDLLVGDYLEVNENLDEIISIQKIGEIEVFDILETESHTFIANNINNHNCSFLGSSHTLISSEKLAKMEQLEPILVRDGKLRIYEEPIKGHKYIMSVDPAKDGKDAFAVQVVDITDFCFKQVATAQLQIDYLLMPEYINDWCEYYNKPYLVIENNEGAGQSIADQMYKDYEYENIHVDKDSSSGKRKKYSGFRTTPKSRKLILQTLKLFIENDRLNVVDKSTINEFLQFILVNNKYQADEGSHDDMIMSLALIFVPFCNSKNFEDMKSLVKNLYSVEPDENNKSSFSDHLSIGYFDDGIEDSEMKTRAYSWNGFMVEESYES